jgi:hypothetical protein
MIVILLVWLGNVVIFSIIEISSHEYFFRVRIFDANVTGNDAGNVTILLRKVNAKGGH